MNALADAGGVRPAASFAQSLPLSGRVWGMPRVLLPIRLAWRQLRSDHVRLWAAVAGVMFASVLVLMQLGFRAALFDTAVALPQAMRGELFLISPLTEALFRAAPIARARGYQALAVPGVEKAVPIYLAQEPWRNPQTGTHRYIQLIGFDTKAGAIDIPGLASVADRLTERDAVAFDALSRPEFGDIPRLLAEHGGLKGELAGREIDVVGMVRLGPSFDADGSVVMSETTFRSLVSGNPASNVALIALRLNKGVDASRIAKELTKVLPPDVRVYTHRGIMTLEKRYWDKATPIGVIFAFGSLMGLIVGMVIVYQILFTEVASHLRAYATLKAVGFSHRYLQAVVLGEACILACLGYLPGALLSGVLCHYVGRAAYMPLELTIERCMGVFAVILGMCMSAGALALHKLREADPASVF